MTVIQDQNNNDDEGEFLASVITDKFKDAFNTTQNPNDWNLKNIYNGGYSPMLGTLEQPQITHLDFNNNTLSASAITVINPNLENQNQNSTIFVDGMDVPVNDIVAKAAIPYTKGLRKRFINATMSDPVISTVFSILTFYVFNVGRKSAIRPIGDYRTKNINELNQMLGDIINTDIQEDCTNYLDNVDTHSHIWDYYAPLAFQHMLSHGTGIFFKELMNTNEIVNEELDINIPLGTPGILKELDPIYFEKIFQNRKTFKPLFLEYTDQNYELIDDEIFNNPKADKDISNEFKGWKQLVIKDPNKNNNNKTLMLPINQLVVFRNQMNIAPNVSFFGISKIFASLPISEIQRELNYNVMPSVNKVQSQGSCIINTKIKSKAQNQELVKQLQQGTNYIVTNTEGLDIKNIAINVDLAGLAKERFDNVLQIIMGLNFPSPLINFEGVSNRACYSEDTETLTDKGWKYYYDIDPYSDKIATVNPDTLELEYYLPEDNKLYLYDYEGEMLHFKNIYQDILVTPDHKMFNYNGNEWEKIQAKELLTNNKQIEFLNAVLPSVNTTLEEAQILELPQIEYYNRNINAKTEQVQKININSWVEFIGYYLSEGVRTYKENGIYHVALSQNTIINKYKADQMQKCLDNFPFKFGSYFDKKDKTKRWQIDNKQLHTILKHETGDYQYNRRIPRSILNNGTIKQLQILLDSMLLGDGTKQKSYNGITRTQQTYYTTSKQLADDVQELAFKLGNTTSITTSKDARGGKRRTVYRVNISQNQRNKTVKLQNKSIKIRKKGKNKGNMLPANVFKEQYKGKVYCFNVKNHIFVTRRNNKIAIQGNTMDTVLQFFQNTSLESLRDIVSTAMSDQWYMPNLMFYFNHVLPSTTLEGSPKEINKWNFINLKLKIITEFEKIDFDLFTEKLKALQPVTFMDDQEKREKCGIDPFPISDPEADNMDKVNNELQDIGEIQKDPTRLLSDKDQEIADIKAQLAEVLANIKDPEVLKLVQQRITDKGI